MDVREVLLAGTAGGGEEVMGVEIGACRVGEIAVEYTVDCGGWCGSIVGGT